jgi:DinB superfamily
MALLHDAPTRRAIETRLGALRPDTTPRWGRMSVDQMLWHANRALDVVLGQYAMPPEKAPLPKPVMKFIVLKLPWAKNMPTSPHFVAKEHYDFEAERLRCLRLVDMLVQRPLTEAWPDHPFFGPMSGREVSTLMAKHLSHHLGQFCV